MEQRGVLSLYELDPYLFDLPPYRCEVLPRLSGLALEIGEPGVPLVDLGVKLSPVRAEQPGVLDPQPLDFGGQHPLFGLELLPARPEEAGLRTCWRRLHRLGRDVHRR
ncbi:hypothetical protein GCM10022225_00900 [Plantactinospora mayteni]|uniref:Uncharacterized protein n=1 Tax=Plantactinospora mayteni TaxID=566021 RepID=A0ABQ4EYF4_9ACTN|nr:hypothetical protein Pma05_62550 [Plantactinospora mayteni]